MKIRNGFVSNSSSSSFLIFMKGELTKENFLWLLGVDENNPVGRGASKMFDYFTKQRYSHFVSDAEGFNEFLKQHGWEELDPEEYYTRDAIAIQNLFESGFSFIDTYLSDNEDEEEMAFNGFLTTIANCDCVTKIDGSESLYVVKEQR
jgi:hypothetical protein